MQYRLGQLAYNKSWKTLEWRHLTLSWCVLALYCRHSHVFDILSNLIRTTKRTRLPYCHVPQLHIYAWSMRCSVKFSLSFPFVAENFSPVLYFPTSPPDLRSYDEELVVLDPEFIMTITIPTMQLCRDLLCLGRCALVFSAFIRS